MRQHELTNGTGLHYKQKQHNSVLDLNELSFNDEEAYFNKNRITKHASLMGGLKKHGFVRIDRNGI